MKMISKTLKILVLFLFILGVTSCNNDDNGSQTPSVVNVISDNSNLSALEQAVNLVGLDALLREPGPYTIFAPDNNAFQLLLDSNTSWNSLNDIPPVMLTNILSNHVVPGSALSSSDLISENSGYLTTASTIGPNETNLSLYYNVNGTTVEINGGIGSSAAPRKGADVILADLIGPNGIVHVINRVLLAPTVVDMAIANPNLSSLVASLTTTGQANVESVLTTPNGSDLTPFTLFAPTNTAFAALLDSNPAWNSPADIDSALLTAVLEHHVITGASVTSGALTDGVSPGTLEGDTITINLPGNDGNPAKITDGSGNTDIDIIAVDIQTANGIIHVVEAVLIPNTTN